jgi:hypothetical protein
MALAIGLGEIPKNVIKFNFELTQSECIEVQKKIVVRSKIIDFR